MDRNPDLAAPAGARAPLQGLGGVCAGLGRRFGIDPCSARILFVLILMLVPGSQLPIYPVLWVLMPRETHHAAGSTSAPAPA